MTIKYIYVNPDTDKVELTRAELDELLKAEYARGYSAGSVASQWYAPTYPLYPSYTTTPSDKPYWWTEVTCNCKENTNETNS